ncbi:MAG TPA: extracellular solute-binding protein [Stellaceae bacterium]|nr:extracellular solute-binding protein [Stellaceae bacterium]
MWGLLGRTAWAALAPLVLLYAAAPARAESIDDIYAKAKTEGALVLWGAGPTAGYEAAVKAFQERYPGVKVALTGGFSNVLNAKVVEQVKANKVETDMVVFQTVQDFVGWKKNGWLLAFKPDGFDKIGAGMKDKDGAWIAVNANPLFYGYNTDGVKPADVPKSALDFLKPQFKGKLITAYPADDDATLYDFYTVVQKYGWGYMDKYMAQQPKFIQGHLGVARSLGSGESLASFDNSLASTGNVKREGGKIQAVAPAKDALPVFFTSEAILKAAPHPNAARLFVTFYLSKEWQSRTGGYSSRSDVPPPAGQKPLSSYKLANRYLQFVTNEKQLIDLRKRFEAYSGPVTNAGGVK